MIVELEGEMSRGKPCKGFEHLPKAVPKHKLPKRNNCRRTIIKPGQREGRKNHGHF